MIGISMDFKWRSGWEKLIGNQNVVGTKQQEKLK